MFKSRTQGFTLTELLVVMAIIGILTSMAALNVRGLNNDAEAASSILSGAFIQARTQAISTTSAVRVTPSDARTLTFERSPRCDASTWTALPNINATLPDRVTVTGTGTPWRVCFTTRGELPTLPPSTLRMTDERGRSRTLTFYLTGSVANQ
ncbi:GspH/FimT family pseudopilin [Deinococcus sp. SM5_A1]|uniref:GspH/FimT family pseudopilin n=1 Tax=Deinococcus sp. SM5_A1 TaxID=3379094 RepID=UPI00385B2325